jgi:hypothetical protein
MDRDLFFSQVKGERQEVSSNEGTGVIVRPVSL